MKKYVNQKLIGEKSIDEIDWVLKEEFGLDDINGDFDDELIVIEEGRYYTDSHIINVDKIIAELEELKSNGATHVTIDYHCDHIGYDIAGFLITESTEEEINDYVSKKEAKKQKEIKRSELLRQLSELDNPVIEKDPEDLPF